MRIRGVKAEEKERTESTKRRIEYRPNRVEISSYGVTRARVYMAYLVESASEKERDVVRAADRGTSRVNENHDGGG